MVYLIVNEDAWATDYQSIGKFPRSALAVSSKVVCRLARRLFVTYVCDYLNVLIT